MRLTDDLADDLLIGQPGSLSSSEPAGLRGIQEWRTGLRACLTAEDNSHLLYPALREVVQRYQIDPAWLEDVITGMEADLTTPVIPSYPELQHYCYLVAGTVGLCCQAIWQADLQKTRSLAITCGEAFQLTNILRDLSEDAERNRCYLPLDELQQFHYTPELLQRKVCTENLLPLMRFQLERAEACYRQAAQLEDLLQGGGLRMFRVMFRTYYSLLQQIKKNPVGSLQQRVRLSRPQRIGLLISSPHRKLQRLF